mmetsp:Transcript_21924/g.26706  ORF Transcript_21924/g.26706 Transcript_21924/m.26706 type:complete len:240 (+) Transcript_21924:318-1037(+)
MVVDSVSESASAITDLEKQLDQERKRCQSLSTELTKYKELLVRQNAENEAEEESITNRLCKQVSSLIKEKEKIALEAEREEEYLTNVLQRQMHNLRQEKVNLETQLECEQEFATNRLMKKLSELQREKQNLERKLEAETCSHLLEMEKYLEKLNESCDNCCRKQTLKNEESESKIECSCRKIADELSRDVEQKKGHESARTKMFFSELEKLKDENFLLKQRVNAEREKRTAIETEKVIL